MKGVTWADTCARRWVGLALAATLGVAFVACAGGDEVGLPVPGNGNEGGGSTNAATTAMAATTGPGGSGGESTTSATSSSSTTGGGNGGNPSAYECFADDFVNPPTDGPDYDQFGPVVGTHCHGTDHQDIAGVERVVFLGDSVTVGTPPTESGDFYRSRLAADLANQLSLSSAGFLWQNANPFDGTSGVMEDGSFASCSKWGARTDDLMTQIGQCFQGSDFDATTLIVLTMGGNDIANLTDAAIDGASQEELWAQTEAFVALQREAIEYLVAPGRFPNGVYVVFANMYEFTDGTGEVDSCETSTLAGFDDAVPAPEELKAMVVWANEQFMSIAVDTQTDMIFMLEAFCGHGFNADDPSAPCYRGPGNANWFDLTCIHPNPTGHQQIAGMFSATIAE